MICQWKFLSDQAYLSVLEEGSQLLHYYLLSWSTLSSIFIKYSTIYSELRSVNYNWNISFQYSSKARQSLVIIIVRLQLL
jgi:hypothetical protein